MLNDIHCFNERPCRPDDLKLCNRATARSRPCEWESHNFPIDIKPETGVRSSAYGV